MTPLEEQSDAYLAGCIANGDAEAVRPLIDRYRRPLLALLQRSTAGRGEADDLFQETWMRVVKSAHRYDPDQRFRAWLFAIAWNLIRDQWSRQRATDDVALADELPSREQTPEERAVGADDARRVRELVGALPERLSQAILLRYFEELSEKEVSERLGVPVGTVKSRLHHALRKLASSWNGEPA